MSIGLQLLIATGIVLVALTYIRGWRRWQHGHLAQSEETSAEFREAFQRRMRRRMIGFFVGLTLVSVVLLSPLYTFSTQYFSMRVAQHLLMIAWIPALILSSNPLPILFQGLPKELRQISAEMRPHPYLRDTLIFMTSPGTSLLLFAGTFWIWYDPVVHRATIDYPWLRALEIVTLMGAASLYWWHITDAQPRLHPTLPWWVRVVYTFIGVVTIKSLGLIVMFNPVELYPYPQDFYISGLRVNDELMGGIVFWIIGGSVYATTALLLIRNWLGKEASKPSLPESAWADNQSMLAPGIHKE